MSPTGSPLFRSFWHGGFESASHRNGLGSRVDMIAATQHLEQVSDDYARLRSVGIQVAREGVRWHLVEAGEHFDFSTLEPVLNAARRHGIQVIWTLCHYGWPDDLDVFSPEFIARFARYCAATAQFVANATDEVPYYVPINEISFLAFAAGASGWFSPFALDRGDELKAQLVRAAIAGMDAIWEVDPRARMIHVDPVINVVAPDNRRQARQSAARFTASQFSAWDWLAGRERPELGGAPRYLDIVGVNFYHNNQWVNSEVEGEVGLRWDASPRDARWLPFHQMLARVYARYRRPLFVAETSHVGVGRAQWIEEIASEVAIARDQGVPVEGIALYPILDRPDWHDAAHWHHSGLWDLVPNATGQLERVLVADYAAALITAREALHRSGTAPGYR